VEGAPIRKHTSAGSATSVSRRALWGALAEALHHPGLRRDLAGALAVAAVVLAWSYARHSACHDELTDVEPILVSTRAMLDGRDPFAAVGPGAPFDRPWPQWYPALAFVPLIPLARLPLRLAADVFIALSAGWLTFAILRTRAARAPALASGAFLWALMWRQWSPALVAAALTPPLAGLVVVKPTTGLALLAGSRSRRAAAWAVVGGVSIAAVAFALQPDWISRWLGTFRGWELHFVAPVTRLPFGPLLLLALLRWRRPEARLLVALACIPQTNAVCDVLPLFLVASTFWEAALLAAATHIVGLAQFQVYRTQSFSAYAATSAEWLVVAAYLPCLVMVLRRPAHPEHALAEIAGCYADVPASERASPRAGP
jgi:hypothetical protein